MYLSLAAFPNTEANRMINSDIYRFMTEKVKTKKKSMNFLSDSQVSCFSYI